jgi:hypothetical protein
MKVEHLVQGRELAKAFVFVSHVRRLNGIRHCKIIGRGRTRQWADIDHPKIFVKWTLQAKV